MQVMTVKDFLQSQLRKTAEDPTTVVSIDTSLVANQDKQQLQVAPSNINDRFNHVSQSHALLPAATGDPQGSDFEALKKIAEKLLLPYLSPTSPNEKLLVTGVQIVFAASDFWASISKDAVSREAISIKGAKLAQKAVGAYLNYHNISGLPKSLNSASGLIITTADKVFVATDS